jgi:hypothetical protein
MIRPIALTRDVAPWTEAEMLAIASRGLGRVVRDDVRGATLLSVDEIMAMAGALIALGLVATLPGEATPARLVHPLPEGDRA